MALQCEPASRTLSKIADGSTQWVASKTFHISNGLAGNDRRPAAISNMLCQVVRAVDGHIVAAASTVEAALREALPTRSDKVCQNPLCRWMCSVSLVTRDGNCSAVAPMSGHFFTS